MAAFQTAKRDRKTEARVATTQAAIRRVEDWALRFARNLEPPESVIACLANARREIVALEYDLLDRQTRLPKPETETVRRQITHAACQLVAALSLLGDAPKNGTRAAE